MSTPNNVEDHLPSYRIRPRFQVEIPFSSEELETKLLASLQKENAPVLGRANHGFASFYMPEEVQHYWSPGLTVTYENTDSGCFLRGTYGPRPTVWTMFIFFYSLIAFMIFVISIFGLTNYSLGKSATILWSVPVLMIVFLSLWLVAYFGQKLGHDQMVILHGFLEKSLEVEIKN